MFAGGVVLWSRNQADEENRVSPALLLVLVLIRHNQERAESRAGTAKFNDTGRAHTLPLARSYIPLPYGKRIYNAVGHGVAKRVKKRKAHEPAESDGADSAGDEDGEDAVVAAFEVHSVGGVAEVFLGQEEEHALEHT